MTLQVGAPVQVKVAAGTFPGVIYTATPDENGKQAVVYPQINSNESGADMKLVHASRSDTLDGNNTWRPLNFAGTFNISTGD